MQKNIARKLKTKQPQNLCACSRHTCHTFLTCGNNNICIALSALLNGARIAQMQPAHQQMRASFSTAAHLVCKRVSVPLFGGGGSARHDTTKQSAPARNAEGFPVWTGTPPGHAGYVYCLLCDLNLAWCCKVIPRSLAFAFGMRFYMTSFAALVMPVWHPAPCRTKGL